MALKNQWRTYLRVRQPHPAQWGISGHVSTERVYSSCAVGRTRDGYFKFTRVRGIMYTT
jgi:hypothetical protein